MTSDTPSPDIPNGVSFAQLQAHMVKALPENPKKSTDLFGGKTQEELEELAQKVLDEAYAACKEPMFHKVIAIKMMDLFIEWHQYLATAAAEESNQEFANSCYRDIGVLETAVVMLRSVSFSRRDFTAG